MSPREIAEGTLRKLLAEIEADRRALNQIAARISSGADMRGAGSDEAGKAYVAVELHRYYTALETLLERILRIFDEDLPTGPASHRELLAQASRETPGVRPTLLDGITYGELTHLLSFRHFFRHAYAVELDWARLDEHRARIARIHPNVDLNLDRIAAYFRASLIALGA